MCGQAGSLECTAIRSFLMASRIGIPSAQVPVSKIPTRIGGPLRARDAEARDLVRNDVCYRRLQGALREHRRVELGLNEWLEAALVCDLCADLGPYLTVFLRAHIIGNDGREGVPQGMALSSIATMPRRKGTIAVCRRHHERHAGTSSQIVERIHSIPGASLPAARPSHPLRESKRFCSGCPSRGRSSVNLLLALHRCEWPFFLYNKQARLPCR